MNKIIPHLTSASPLSNYRLSVDFEDGVQGIIDLNEWKGRGVFKFWNDEANFKSFKITADRKIEWTDEIDMDPDAFYLKLVGKTFEEYAGNQQFLRHSY